MRTFSITVLSVLLVGLLVAWNTVKEEMESPAIIEISKDFHPVITAEEQANMTPELILKSLLEGNERFMANALTERDLPSQVAASASGQFPKAVVLSCLDSRIPVEMVFDKSVGDIFVGRVAGNFVNEDMLGSMEFGCIVAGSKLIVVMGHESCGAVKAAIDDVKLGNIAPMLKKLKPAVKMSNKFEGDQNSKNGEYVAHVSTNNVHHTIKTIRDQSPILRQMEDNGEIKIVGAMYDMETGKVRFLDS